jgi:hypothetical protein
LIVTFFASFHARPSNQFFSGQCQYQLTQHLRSGSGSYNRGPGSIFEDSTEEIDLKRLAQASVFATPVFAFYEAD